MQKAEMGHRDYRTTDYGTRGERGSGNGECRQAPPKLHPCDIVKGMQKGAEEKQKLGKHKAESGGESQKVRDSHPKLHQCDIKATSERQQGVLIAR